MWSNFHMHSNYCDGKGAIKEYVVEAIRHNMPTIGFSSHAPVPFPSVWCMKADAFGDYLMEIDKLSADTEGVEIYKGLEVDFIPGVIGPKDFNHLLDYSIGSVHFVDSFQGGRHWEIDGLHSVFLEGLEKIFSGNIRNAIDRYYELTREMIETSPPTVVGHMDKIKIQNIENKFFHEDDTWYRQIVDKTIESIKTNELIVEVNTRGLYQGKSSTPYPSPWILEKLCKLRIPITLNSDTHHPSDIVNRFPETARMLRQIGFDTLHVLSEGTWQPFTFNENGILF